MGWKPLTIFPKIKTKKFILTSFEHWPSSELLISVSEFEVLSLIELLMLYLKIMLKKLCKKR